MERSFSLLLLTAVVIFISCVDALAAESVKLIVDTGGIKTANPVPVRTGVPVARGKLSSTDNVRLLIGGREIESQVRALSRSHPGPPAASA